MIGSAIAGGTITAFFLFDVAEAVDLTAVSRLIRSTVPAPLALKPTAPPYMQYRLPPVVIDGSAAGVAEIDRFTVRLKVFDYGVISVALTRPMPSSWDHLLTIGQSVHDDPALARAADGACRALLAEIDSAVTKPRAEFLSEDYVVFAVTRLDEMPTAEELMAARGAMIAQLLRGERETLSPQERAEVLGHQMSYLTTDVVVPTWNAAFVYDTESGAQSALEILEFANSQLLEFRYYDTLLDTELTSIYAQLQSPSGFQSWFGRRYTRAARQVHALFIDLNELTDRTENALKIAGDVYAARLMSLAGSRLGLDHWKHTVREKLQTVDDIYHFAVEQTSMSRGEQLELMIVLILVFELVLFFMGIMR